MAYDPQDVMEKPSVTIGLSVNGAGPRVFRVSLTRFSWIVTLILALLTWSAIATVWLIQTTVGSKDEEKTTQAAAAREIAPIVPVMPRASAQKAAPVSSSWKTASVKETRLSAFTFEEGFALSDIRLHHISAEHLKLSFTLTNTTGELKEGQMWALARFTDGEGKRVDVLSSQNVGIQEDGTALDSRLGSRFAIQNHKERELDLRGAVPEGMRLQSIAVGVRFLAEPDQKVLTFRKFEIN